MATGPGATRGSGRSTGAGHAARARVLFVGDFAASRRGNFSVSERLAELLGDEGFGVATTSSLLSSPLRALDMVRSAVAERGRVDVAVIDVYSGRAFMWAEWTASVLAAAKVPLVLVLRGGNLPRFAAAEPERVSRLFAKATVVVALSDFLREALAPYRADCVVVPNPLDAGAYPFRLRERLEPRLVWLRAFHEIYNPPLGPRALAELTSALPDATLTMIGSDKGDGSLARTLAAAADLGVASRLKTPGPVDKAAVPAALDAADVFLNTTNVDNVPISVLEAMACGLCVVSTDVGGIPYLATDGHDALLVPPDDPVAMAQAVTRLFREPGLAARLSANARERALANDWSAVLPRWTALLDDVAHARPLRGRARGGRAS
ncbi:MAG: glycosyltransferase family 4 protein [Trueperaceae bacterium]|nr:glycosyltransferase family 4 protein [Trueperaceae bacterium]